MGTHTEAAVAKPMPAPPKIVGFIGTAASAAGLVFCLGLFFYGVAKVDTRGVQALYGLVLTPVAALGAWLFWELLRLRDWTVAPEVPLGVKLLGNLGRVLGTLGAAACVALLIVSMVYPDKVPPLPLAKEGGAVSQAPRPGLAAVYFFGIFGCLAVRFVASAMAEVRRWARVGSLLLTGAAVVGFTVALILCYTRWQPDAARLAAGKTPTESVVARSQADVAKLPLWVLDVTSGALFLFLLGYLMLPECSEAFESRKL